MKKKKLMYKSFLSMLLGFGIFMIPAFGQVGNNADLSLAWHEADDEEYGRGYTLKVGFDIDEDGWGEMLVYERLNESSTVYKISLFEANADNSYTEVWFYQFASADIACGERGLMVTDWDNDGFSEITAVMCTIDGVNNAYVWEWDGTDNGLPSTPTAQFDIARDTGGVVALENNVQYLQMDDDANLEMVLTHRGGNSTFLQILELSNSDLGSPVWNVEFTDDWTGAKNSGFGITDIDHDGHKEIIMWNEGTGDVRVYENTGTDTYEVVNTWTPTPSDYVGATVKSLIPAVDFDKDGVDELYLSDSKGLLWVITPNGDVSTMFDDANWHVLHDWKLDGYEYNEGGEVRGCIPGDLDRDGLPDLYFAGNNFGAIMDMEYEGGSVTGEASYSFYYTIIDGGEVAGGHFGRPANVDIGDMDNDGHLEIVATVPWTGDNPVDNLKGLYVFEFENTQLSIDVPFDQVPMVYSLRQNYPNPFNPVTRISYDIIEPTNVTIRIYDLLGQSVKTLVNERKDVGFYTTLWNGLDQSGATVASGVYIYRFETERFTATKKMLLLK